MFFRSSEDALEWGMRPILRRSLDFLTGMVEAGGTMVCLATVVAALGRWHWMLDVFSHFRVQYALALVLACVWMFYLKRWAFTALFLCFAAANTLGFAGLFVPPPLDRSPAIDPVEFRLMLLNVNTSLGDPERMVAEVEREDPDLLVLQELGPRWKDEVERISRTRPHRRVVYREDNFGIGVFSRYPLSDTEVLEVGGETVPSIRTVVEPDGRRIQLLATHPLPPVGAEYTASRNRHLAALPALLDESLPGLLMGDLNTTPWNHAFRELLNRTGLRNAAKGYGLQPTWPTMLPPLWIPLDHVLHAEAFEVLDYRVGEDVGSDHFPVAVDLRLR